MHRRLPLPRPPVLRHLRCSLFVALSLATLIGCGGLQVAQRYQLAGVVGVAALAVTPSLDLEQTYYLGSFDPQGQLPPAVYRIRVRGQSSVLNSTRFASSWVPAEVVDALSGSIAIGPKNGKVEIERASTAESLADAGRGLWMFGPEDFREAPRNHRLVIVMGASPETVEQAFASALGTIAKVKFGQSGSVLDSDLFKSRNGLPAPQQRLSSVGIRGHRDSDRPRPGLAQPAQRFSTQYPAQGA